MKKRIFSLFLVIILAFVSVEDVRADAGSLIIAGGSVAGVTAGAVAGPAVVAVFCAMMAFGMNVELTKASEEAGMTKTEFLKNKIQQYCNEAKISATTFNNYVLDQAKILQNGTISISNKASNLIEKFCNWLFSSDQVTDNSGPVPNSVTINGVSCPVIQEGDSGHILDMLGAQTAYYYLEGTYPFAMFGVSYSSGQIEFYVCSKNPDAFSNASVKAELTYNGEFMESYNTAPAVYNDVYVAKFFGCWARDATNISIPYFQNTTVVDICETIQELDLGGVVSQSEDKITGNQAIYDNNKIVLENENNKTTIINPGITIPVPVDTDVTIDVNEYLEIIQEMIDGLADDIITAIDDATDVPITIEFDPTQDWDPTIEKEDDTDLPPDDEKTPVIKDDILPHDFDPDPMKFNLKGIFPFCIPWDVKDMLSKLSADPVAPSYTVNWMIPIVNQRLVFTVDLSPFNGVAQVCRTMELLAFCIGLAVVTRQLFLRG